MIKLADIKARWKHYDVGINDIGDLIDEVERLRGIVAAVESLPEKWRKDAKMHTAVAAKETCADELSCALTGGRNDG